jgi:farnesyl diphosphate synthase
MLEGAIYFLLKKHFRGEKYYVDLLELFHDVSSALGLVAIMDINSA